jgi:hypothetical protein
MEVCQRAAVDYTNMFQCLCGCHCHFCQCCDICCEKNCYAKHCNCQHIYGFGLSVGQFCDSSTGNKPFKMVEEADSISNITKTTELPVISKSVEIDETAGNVSTITKTTELPVISKSVEVDETAGNVSTITKTTELPAISKSVEVNEEEGLYTTIVCRHHRRQQYKKHEKDETVNSISPFAIMTRNRFKILSQK